MSSLTCTAAVGVSKKLSWSSNVCSVSYLWTGSLNGILLQIWATWLFFALLVDRGDEIANDVTNGTAFIFQIWNCCHPLAMSSSMFVRVSLSQMKG